MRVEVEGTNISFDKKRFTGHDYVAYMESAEPDDSLSDVAVKLFDLVVGTLYIDGNEAENQDVMALDWFDEVTPVFVAASGCVHPKAQRGSTTDES